MKCFSEIAFWIKNKDIFEPTEKEALQSSDCDVSTVNRPLSGGFKSFGLHAANNTPTTRVHGTLLPFPVSPSRLQFAIGPEVTSSQLQRV